MEEPSFETRSEIFFKLNVTRKVLLSYSGLIFQKRASSTPGFTKRVYNFLLVNWSFRLEKGLIMSKCNTEAIDIDNEDNVHVVIRFQESDVHTWSFKLFVFDKKGNKKLESLLSFRQSSLKRVYVAVHRDRKIAILNCEKKTLHIGNADVQLNTFKVDKSLSLDELDINRFTARINVTFADFSGTKIIAADCHIVYIYTENGQLQHKVDIPVWRSEIVPC